MGAGPLNRRKSEGLTHIINSIEPREARFHDKESGFSEFIVGEAVLVQRSLLPREPLRTEGALVTYVMRTFHEVGGDFLDYFVLPDGKVGLYVGDVVGKGLPAALYAALAAGGLRAIHKTGTQPSDVLQTFNKRLRVRPIPYRYCTTQYAVFDPTTLELRVANAGLPRPLHLSEAKCCEIGDGGLPSGLFDVATYDQYAIRLSPGDAVLFTTDGISEALDKNGQPLDAERVLEVCKLLDHASPDVFLRHLFDAVEEHTDGKMSDDMTAVLLKVPSLQGSDL